MKIKKIILFLLLFIGLNISYSPQVGYNLSAGTEAFGCEEDDDSWWDEVDALIESGDIEYNEWSSTEDFFTFADPEVLEDVFESLGDLGFDEEHISSLLSDYSDELNSNMIDQSALLSAYNEGVDYRLERIAREYSVSNQEVEYTNIYGPLYGDGYRNIIGREPVNKPGNEDTNYNGIKDKAEDLNGNGINDFAEDLNGNLIPDKEEYSAQNGGNNQNNGEENNDISNSEPYDPNEFEGDEPDSSEGSTRNLGGEYPVRETPINLPTDAEKNAYIKTIVEDMTEKLQEKLGDDFVPFPATFYMKTNKSGYAVTENQRIGIKDKFFQLSDGMQKATIYHEYIHYYNERKGINTMRYSKDKEGNQIIYFFETAFTHNSPAYEHSQEIKNYLERVFSEDYKKGYYSGTYEAEKEKFMRQYSPREVSNYTYRPSNYYQDEIAAYNAHLQGIENGWYTLSETEILETKYKIEQFEMARENALQYEQINNIAPSGYPNP
ncbi:MAG: hypothetical protein JXQ69_04770 [Paludibacteraceae bacterium]|nr:hypothetical protein [Paludibacteraceae bacterium]MBN2787621.1 hypothetical protein [Paludibacteraceae bacterium]